MDADDPDNVQPTAGRDGGHDDRITGRRSTIVYLGLGTRSGRYGQGGGLPPTGSIESDEIEMHTDGCVEFVVSSRPTGGIRLPMTPETGRDSAVGDTS